MTSPHQILKEFWGYDNFRPLQEDIIKAVLDGKDTLALMPTGGGKSLCYQVPALAQDGLCLVISPLIALMKDQVENLRRKNITAFAIYSGMTRIAALREELPGIPILALTASATPDVQNDICEKLAFKNYQVFRQSFERPNLSYSTFKVDSKINKIIEIVRRVQGSSIIYCKSRKRTKEISELLQLQNISSDFYHAGLLQDVRNRKQEDWIHNKTRIIVCIWNGY